MNIRDSRHGDQNSLQQHHILRCLVNWSGTNSLAKLVDSVLGNHGQDNLGLMRINMRRMLKNEC